MRCRQLFDAIAAAPSTTSFVVKAQFLEIYNEELRDLLAGRDQDTASPGASPAAGCCGSPSHQRPIAIRECPDGQIMVTGERRTAAQPTHCCRRALRVPATTCCCLRRNEGQHATAPARLTAAADAVLLLLPPLRLQVHERLRQAVQRTC